MRESPPSFPSRRTAIVDPLEVVRRQLARARRRSNAYAVQNAAYRAAAAALAGVSLLALFALVLPASAFAVATWLLLVAVAGAGAAFLSRVRRDWIRAGDAAAAVDRRARLEERLVTLLSVEPERSRLWPHLVRQNLRVLPRWSPRELVPHAVPRSARAALWALLLAVTALLAVRGLRPAELPIPGGGDPGGSVPLDEGPDASAGGSAPAADRDSPLAALLAGVPERLRQAILGTAGNSSARAAVSLGGTASAGRGRFPQASRDGASTRSAGAQALRSPSVPAGPPAAAAGGTRRAPAPSRAIQGDRPQALAAVEVARPRAPSSGERRDPLARSGGGPGASGGSGPAGELFGERDPGARAAGTFELDLAGRSGGTAPEGAPPGPAPRPDVALAEDFRLDDAIRRAQVPPEYEPVVRRLFRRGTEEEAERGAR